MTDLFSKIFSESKS